MIHRIWMLDVAREQCPRLDDLYQFASLAQEAGFTSLGLYLEHRFAYPSTPWAHGNGCVTPQAVKALQSEFPSLTIMPFINLLGHVEGFLGTVHGAQFAEGKFGQMQACPCNPEFRALADKLLEDTIDAFTSEIIHIGGDETDQLGQCARCRERSPEELYGEHFGGLASRTLELGRRPAIWGDMLLRHPGVAGYLPKETLVFDWQYDLLEGPLETSETIRQLGFEVIACPSLRVYCAPWFDLAPSQKNVEHLYRETVSHKLEGLCLATWEFGLMSPVDTLLPAIRATGDLWANGGELDFVKAYGEAAEWAQLMGVDLHEIGGAFNHSMFRNRLKSRFLLMSNPFLVWSHHAGQMIPLMQKTLDLLDRAKLQARTEGQKGVTAFIRAICDFVLLSEAACEHYAAGEPEAAIGKLMPTRQMFDDLASIARASHKRTGGSLADIERCRLAKEHVERVMARIRKYGDGALGYLPSWAHLTDLHFVPHDQTYWWKVNGWADCSTEELI